MEKFYIKSFVALLYRFRNKFGMTKIFKKNVKFSNLFSLIFVLLSVISSCSIYQSEFEVQSDKGVPIQKIELESSLILSGIRGVTSQALTASYYPSTAQDTEITWTSSDESVVSISSASGTTCTLLLQGNGQAQVTAKNSSGKVSAICNVKGTLSTSSPFEAQDFSLTSYSNNVQATWKTPSLNAEYLSGAIFKVYETDFDTLVGTTQISGTSEKDTSYSVRLGGGISDLIYDDYTVSSSGYTLEPSSQYKVELYIVDLNGNLSPVSTQTATTLASSSSSVSSVSNAQISDISDSSLSFTWTDSTDSDFQGVLVRVFNASTNEKSATDTFVSAGLQTATIENLSEKTSFNCYIYAIDNNFNLSEPTELSYTYSADTFVSDIASSLSSEYSGLIDFTWTDPVTDFSKIKISAISSYEKANSLSSVELSVEKGVQTASFENLMAGYEYTFIFTVLDSDDNLLSSKSYKAYPSKVLIRFYSRENSGFMVVTSAKAFKTQDGSSAAYHYKWLKMKALNGSETKTYDGDSNATGTVQTYSIMAMNLDGTASGLYAYLTSADSSNSGGAEASMSIASSSDIEAASLQSYATFFNAATLDSSYKALRFAENYYQLGGDGSSSIYYRTSAGTPGYSQWHWSITQESAN